MTRSFLTHFFLYRPDSLGSFLFSPCTFNAAYEFRNLSTTSILDDLNPLSQHGYSPGSLLKL